MVPSSNISNTFVQTYTINEIANINYSIVNKSLCKYNIFKFNTLKSYFPNLKSTKEFIRNKNYLGDIRIRITSAYENLSNEILYQACLKVLKVVGDSISAIQETYKGTREFTVYNIHDIFTNKRCNYTDPHNGDIGMSQNDISVDKKWRLDLLQEDWYAYEDNYGTSEEKSFVAYFKKYVDELKQKYDKVYLVRNERQLAIYSFDDGQRFEPDYLLFLHSSRIDGYEQLQIFIEPKGSHLLEKDKWKEDFLLQIEKSSIPVVKFADDNNYKIWGFHFYNEQNRDKNFDKDMRKL